MIPAKREGQQLRVVSTLEGGASGSTRRHLDDLGYYEHCIINVREDGAPVCWVDGYDAMSGRCAEFRNSGNDAARRQEREKIILQLVSPLCMSPAMNWSLQ
jgi:hypothetical protein